MLAERRGGEAEAVALPGVTVDAQQIGEFALGAGDAVLDAAQGLVLAEAVGMTTIKGSLMRPDMATRRHLRRTYARDRTSRRIH